MIATVLLAGLFVLLGSLGGWMLYTLSELDDYACDTCGRQAGRKERHSWIEYRGDVYCSGDCFRGRHE